MIGARTVASAGASMGTWIVRPQTSAWSRFPPIHSRRFSVRRPNRRVPTSSTRRRATSLPSSPDDDRLSFEGRCTTFGPRVTRMPPGAAPGAQVSLQSNRPIAEAVDTGAVVHPEAPHHMSRRDRSVGPRNGQPRNRRVPSLASTRKVRRDVGRDAIPARGQARCRAMVSPTIREMTRATYIRPATCSIMTHDRA